MTKPAFLLDSNICIYILSDAESLPAQRVQQQEPGSVVISAIVAAEIFCGAPFGQAEADVLASTQAFLDAIPVMPFDAEAAARFRDVPFRRGRFDRLIAAHALALDLTLVTNNEADFADMTGLRVENWTRP